VELGIAGRKAIVCASSKGLGRACARALAEAGCAVVLNGRDTEVLGRTARELREATGAQIREIPGDLDNPATRAELIAACPDADILVNNNGGPPLRDFRSVDRDALLAGVIGNMATPIELVQKVIDSMVERKFGRILNITSSSVKAPIAGLDLSSGARAGLTGFLAGVARSVAHANVTINFLLPGAFDTKRLKSGQEAFAKRQGLPIEQVENEARSEIPAKRFGTPEEFGKACAFLCSAHAGYITGQSLLIDGGAYPGIL
jgi:3-oxoacyl-[acyl-carrier protein] reductase